MLAYESQVPKNIRSAFTNKVREISQRLEISPNWLMAIMSFESANTFSPSIRNKSTNATGLIQFMPSTAKGLGTSTQELSKMTAVEQLDYVEKYFNPYKGKMKNYIDTYFVVFFPLAVGKPDDWVLQSKGLSASKIALQNEGLDVNKDGKITVKEVKTVMLRKLPSEWRNNPDFNLFTSAYKNEISALIVGVVVLSIGAYYLYKKR
jgi:hypothetical protein